MIHCRLKPTIEPHRDLKGRQVQVTWQDAKDLSGADTKEFILETERGRPVTGAVWLTGDAPSALMCFGHGASDDRYQDPICDLAARFRDVGVASISIDGPVHGLRRVEPGGRGALMTEMQRSTVFDDMLEDWTLALELARTLPSLETVQLGYFGLSMGSIFGIPFAASRDDMTAGVFGLLGISDSGWDKVIGDAASKINIPLRFIVQLEDELFDRESCLRLFDTFASDYKSIGANSGLHPEVPSDEIDLAFNFLCQHFRGEAVRRIPKFIAK